MSSPQPHPTPVDFKPDPGRLRSFGQWTPSLALGLALCVIPAVLWRESAGEYILKLDDYAYIASGRDPANLRRSLLKPHNAHVVPIFRLETHLLLKAAGSLAAAPAWLEGAAYGTLVLAMLATGHLIARESGRAELGLMAMAAVGLSTILGPSALWYSASQATLSGVMILATLICLQAWRARGGWAGLALGLMVSAASPFSWSVGYAAGPIGAAYLWADGRRRCRIAALVPLVGSAIAVGAIWMVSGREIVPAVIVDDRQWEGWTSRIVHAVELTAQATSEFLMLGNLGLDSRSAVTGGQGVLFCVGLAGIWVASRSRRRQGSGPIRPTPLEAAGVAMVLVGFMAVYTARGSYGFENLRALGWYHAVPQLGAVLFASGWYSSGAPPSPTRISSPPTPRALLSVAMLAMVLLGLQSPRAHRIIFDYDGLAAPTGAPPEIPSAGTLPESSRSRRFALQQRFLASADRVEAACRDQAIGRDAFRQAFGPSRIPGTPDALAKLGLDDLLMFTKRGTMTDRRLIEESVGPILAETLGSLPR